MRYQLSPECTKTTWWYQCTDSKQQRCIPQAIRNTSCSHQASVVCRKPDTLRKQNMMLILRSGCLKTFALKPKYSLFIKIKFRIMIYDNLFFLIWSTDRFWTMCANWQKLKFSYFNHYQNIVKKKEEKFQVRLVFEYFFKNPETLFRTAKSLAYNFVKRFIHLYPALRYIEDCQPI